MPKNPCLNKCRNFGEVTVKEKKRKDDFIQEMPREEQNRDSTTEVRDDYRSSEENRPKFLQKRRKIRACGKANRSRGGTRKKESAKGKPKRRKEITKQRSGQKEEIYSRIRPNSRDSLSITSRRIRDSDVARQRCVAPWVLRQMLGPMEGGADSPTPPRGPGEAARSREQLGLRGNRPRFPHPQDSTTLFRNEGGVGRYTYITPMNASINATPSVRIRVSLVQRLHSITIIFGSQGTTGGLVPPPPCIIESPYTADMEVPKRPPSAVGLAVNASLYCSRFNSDSLLNSLIINPNSISGGTAEN
ncbi:hypothetical protein H6P81_014504 [Aristolochia fimbriata]|uniref:Uncharacterized protein n=1 Tax=Aristolochia fimbriata TaxID=158543 RepID=A0AAV7EKH4_ARIFI|nr:hypothetical protein H6P81_014504 [Aristolochia fimbriata]